MKKIFTLIAMALMAMSVNAQDWNATNSGTLEKGAQLLDNDYATVVTGVQASATAVIKNEQDQNDPKTYGGYTFTKYVNIRVTDAPAEANNWEGSAYADCNPVGISLIVTAKKNTDVTLYYKHGDGKAVSCYDQTAKKEVSIAETPVTGLSQYYTGTYQFIEGHKYTIYSKGGTTGINGISTAEGTYVAPDPSASGTIYISWNDAPTLSNKTTEEMTSTGTSKNLATWDGGFSIMIMRSDKGMSNGNNITIDGTEYKSIKLSNGAQNLLTLPSGKVAKGITFYSYVNNEDDGWENSYWKEVAGTTYEASTMTSCKDGASPDKREFTFPEGTQLNKITFTNSGKQLCYVIKIDIIDGSETTGIQTVKSETIDVNAPAYNLAGQKVDKSFKGVVIQNGKKMIQK